MASKIPITWTKLKNLLYNFSGDLLSVINPFGLILLSKCLCHEVAAFLLPKSLKNGKKLLKFLFWSLRAFAAVYFLSLFYIVLALILISRFCAEEFDVKISSGVEFNRKSIGQCSFLDTCWSTVYIESNYAYHISSIRTHGGCIVAESQRVWRLATTIDGWGGGNRGGCIRGNTVYVLPGWVQGIHGFLKMQKVLITDIFRLE